jgi:hypothetical protein
VIQSQRMRNCPSTLQERISTLWEQGVDPSGTGVSIYLERCLVTSGTLIQGRIGLFRLLWAAFRAANPLTQSKNRLTQRSLFEFEDLRGVLAAPVAAASHDIKIEQVLPHTIRSARNGLATLQGCRAQKELSTT